MARVIVVRHGQTEWNRVERFRGRIDLALNETGRVQATRVAANIASCHRPVAAVYSSPLKRAMETAEPIARACGLAVQSLDLLIDVDYGTWQGMTPEEVAERHPEQHRQWEAAPDRVIFPEGESIAAVRGRADAALRWAAQKHAGQIAIFVTHKVVAKLLVCAALGISSAHLWQIQQDNGAIDVLAIDGGRWVVEHCNETSHLEDLAGVNAASPETGV